MMLTAAVEPTGTQNSAPKAQTQAKDPLHFIQNASDLMEYEVQNTQGERLGAFSDIVIDMESGQIEFVAVGPGESPRLVPVQALKTRPDQKHLVLDINQDRWEEAPTAERGELERIGREDEAREIYNYYGLNHRPAIARADNGVEYGAADRTPIDVGPAVAPPRSQPRLLPNELSPGDPTIRRSAPAALPADREGLERELRPSQEFGLARDRDAVAAADDKDRDLAVDDQARKEMSYGSPASREADQSQLVWGSDLLRQDVSGENQEAQGEIVDLIIDLHVGYAQHAIVSYGEADEAQTFALPLRDIKVSDDGDVTVERNLADLKDAEEFETETARLRRYEAFRYNDSNAIEFGSPTRPSEKADSE